MKDSDDHSHNNGVDNTVRRSSSRANESSNEAIEIKAGRPNNESHISHTMPSPPPKEHGQIKGIADRRGVKDGNTDYNINKLVEVSSRGYTYVLFTLMGCVNFVDAIETGMLPLLFPILKSYFDHIEHNHLALLGSMTGLGMLCGAIVMGRASDLFGRRNILLMSLFITFLFALCSALSPTFYVLVAFRFLLGVGYGGNKVINYTILAELSPSNIRGRLLMLQDIFYAFGYLSSVGLSFYLLETHVDTKTGESWRWLVVVSSLPGLLVFIVACFILVESPRYLHNKHRYDDLYKTLVYLQTWDSDTNRRNNHEQLKQCVDKLSVKHTHSTTNTQNHSSTVSPPGTRSNRTYLYTLLPLGLVWFLNSFGGGIMLFVPLYLTEKANGQMSSAYLAALLQSCGVLAGCLLFAFALIYLTSNRLTLMRVGLVLTSICVYGLGVAGNQGGASTYFILVLPVLETIRSGTQAMLYIYTPEIFPTQFRSTAFGICSGLHRLAPVLSPFVASYLLLHTTFLMSTLFFGTLFFLGGIVSVFLYIDTNGIIEQHQHYHQSLDTTIHMESGMHFMNRIAAAVCKYACLPFRMLRTVFLCLFCCIFPQTYNTETNTNETVTLLNNDGTPAAPAHCDTSGDNAHKDGSFISVKLCGTTIFRVEQQP